MADSWDHLMLLPSSCLKPQQTAVEEAQNLKCVVFPRFFLSHTSGPLFYSILCWFSFLRIVFKQTILHGKYCKVNFLRYLHFALPLCGEPFLLKTVAFLGQPQCRLLTHPLHCKWHFPAVMNTSLERDPLAERASCVERGPWTCSVNVGNTKSLLLVS